MCSPSVPSLDHECQAGIRDVTQINLCHARGLWTEVSGKPECRPSLQLTEWGNQKIGNPLGLSWCHWCTDCCPALSISRCYR